jgi:ligand-binding sensor domain-containing protein/signal transduction histidine kinase
MHPVLRRALLVSAVVASAAAQPLPKPASPESVPYSRRIWQSADGLPEDFAQSLAQTPDGYLWIGTSGGLVRFDGIRFTVFNPHNEPAFHDESIYSLLTSADGTLWAGTEGGGLIRYRAGSFRAFGSSEGLTNGFVRVVFEDKDRTLWVGTDDGLFRMRGESLVRVDGRGGVHPVAVHSICQDRQGRLLVGGGGLLILDGGKSAYYTSGESLADSSIRTIRQTSDGALWIGTISGLRRFDHGIAGDPFATPKIIRDTNVDFLAESRRGALWIGTYGQGLMRYAAGKFVRFIAPSSLPHNNVLSIFEDAEDDIWVGTQGGLMRMSPSAATTITTADGIPQSINTIYRDPQGPLLVAALNGRLFQIAHQTLEPFRLPSDLRTLPIRNAFRDRTGALWLGTDGQGVIRLDKNGEARYTMKQGLVNDFVRAFCEDGDGNIWIGTDGGLSRWRNRTFQNFTGKDGLAYASIRDLLVDRDGSLWVATDGGLSHWRDGTFAVEPRLTRFLGEKIWALYQDADGGLWIGTHGAGLFLFKNGQLAQLPIQRILPSDKIHFLSESPNGNLWMSGPAGIASASRAGLEEMVHNPSHQLAVRVYSTSDGLSTNQMNGGVQPAGTTAVDGGVWFPSTKGVVHVETDAPFLVSAPTVLIEQVVADGRAVPLSGEIRTGPGAGKIEVHYTAIRLRSPERTRFKYWMEGFDPEWTDAGQRRIAYYTNLPTGNYRFHVVAYELNDPRHATEHVLTLRWLPHFYETPLFLAVCLFAAGSAAWGGYRLHVRNLGKRFAAVLEERNRLAREMHDTLIQGCVGVSALLEAASSAQEVSPKISTELLNRARNEVRATVDEARLAVWNLRRGSASGEDMVSAISQLTQRIGLESGIPVRFESSGSASPLPAEAEQSLLMLIREALHNALRHAAPHDLSVGLTFVRRKLQVEIRDNGCGFDPSVIDSPNGPHYGLIGMRERASKLGGDFRIASTPGQGTTVRFTIPIARSAGLEGGAEVLRKS